MLQRTDRSLAQTLSKQLAEDMQKAASKAMGELEADWKKQLSAKDKEIEKLKVQLKEEQAKRAEDTEELEDLRALREQVQAFKRFLG